MPRFSLSDQGEEIILDQNASMPLYKQLYERLRVAILAGRLEAGARLPSTRVLAGELGISRNTTALAYELLLLEGYIESRVGDGTRVAHLQPEQLLQVVTHAEKRPGQQRASEPLARADYGDEINASPGVFSVGLPDVTSFPYEIWAKLVARHARQSLQTVSLYQNAQGYAPLRAAIATHIGITRGVQCTPDQIILTAGAQGALDLVARVLLEPGDPVWVEDPGYLGARGALLAARATLSAVPVDTEGLDVEAGRQLCSRARLAVVTPSHQFPTGVPMSLRRRLALLEWGRETQAWIVEDDYDSEYRFSGRPLEALQGLDRARRVIYIGTFSKVLYPALRLGYLVVPPALLRDFLVVRRLVDVHPPLLEQMALADFITEGHFARYLRKMRLRYLERRNTLVDALTRELGGLLEVSIPEAGMHLAAWLAPGTSAEGIAIQALLHGIRLLSIAQYSLRPLQRDGLLLGFANSTPSELRAGIHTLAEAFGEIQP